MPLDTEIITNEGSLTLREFTKKKNLQVLSEYNGRLRFNPAFSMPLEKHLLYEIKTTHGPILASSEHRFLTRYGWKTVSQLRVGDKLLYDKKPQIATHDRLPTVRERLSPQKRIVPLLLNFMQTDPHISPEGCNENYSTYLRMVRKGVRSLPAQPPFLWQILCDKISQLYSWQSYDESHSNQADDREKETLVERTKPKGEKGIWKKMWSPHRPNFSSQMGSETRKPQANVKITEKILCRTPRETPKQPFTKEQNDSTRKNGRINPTAFEPKLQMEQSIKTSTKENNISRLPHKGNKNRDRMQRRLLAQRERIDGTRGTIQEERLYSNNVIGNANQKGFQSHFKEATIRSIEVSSEDWACDLRVPNSNNFFLGNGILTHNCGKTTVAMLLMYALYKDWDDVLNAFIFNLSQLLYKLKRGLPRLFPTITKPCHMRVPVLVIDDFAAQCGKAKTQHEKSWDKFKGAFDTLGTKIAIILATMIEPTSPTEQLLLKYTHEIRVEKLDEKTRVYKYDKVDRQQDYRGWKHRQKKDWREEQEFGKIPLDVYKQYDEMRLSLVDEVFVDVEDSMAEDTVDYALKRMKKLDFELLEELKRKGSFDYKMMKKGLGANTKDVLSRCKARGLVVPIRKSEIGYYVYDITDLGLEILEVKRKRDVKEEVLEKPQPPQIPQ